MNTSTASPALIDQKAPGIALAALLAGLALSIILHLILVEGLRQNRSKPLQSAFREDAGGIQFDCFFNSCRPEPYPAPPSAPVIDDSSLYDASVDPLVIEGRGKGWATIRCEAIDDHTFGRCRWIDESAAGFGDRALGVVHEARPTRRLEPGSSVQLRVRFEH